MLVGITFKRREMAPRFQLLSHIFGPYARLVYDTVDVVRRRQTTEVQDRGHRNRKWWLLNSGNSRTSDNVGSVTVESGMVTNVGVSLQSGRILIPFNSYFHFPFRWRSSWISEVDDVGQCRQCPIRVGHDRSKYGIEVGMAEPYLTVQNVQWSQWHGEVGHCR